MAMEHPLAEDLGLNPSSWPLDTIQLITFSYLSKITDSKNVKVMFHIEIGTEFEGKNSFYKVVPYLSNSYIF